MEFESFLIPLLQQIAITQVKIQNYRELLNQEIQFNLKDLFAEICGNSPIANAYHFQQFLQEHETKPDLQSLESMTKSYNNGTSMNLTFIEFSLIFLCKENKLLAKITLQRNSLGNLPAYLLNYARKILLLQVEIHQKIQEMKKVYSSQAQAWIQELISLDNDQEISEEKLKMFCSTHNIEYERLSQYLKLTGNKTIQRKRMSTLFALKNTDKITKYLRKRSWVKTHKKDTKKVDPYIRPEFMDCLERVVVKENFSMRQMKSIEKHLERMNNQKQSLPEKIKKYQDSTEKKLKQTCQAIKELIWLQKQLEYERMQLSLCTDFYPVLFFNSFTLDKGNLIIASSMEEYLKSFGINISLKKIFCLFKRYSNQDGKIGFNEFCQMFDVCTVAYSQIQKNRHVKGLEDVEIHTKKQFLKLLKTIIRNEEKAEIIKIDLIKDSTLNLRDMFGCLDVDGDGWISITDLRVLWKKIMQMDLTIQEAELFWYRVGLQRDSMLRYEKFLLMLCPKTKRNQ